MSKIDPKQFRPTFLQGLGDLKDGKPRLCVKCPTKLPPRLKYYCSGSCMAEAKADGSYGNEEEK